jgi:hypothetical protein
MLAGVSAAASSSRNAVRIGVFVLMFWTSWCGKK